MKLVLGIALSVLALDFAAAGTAPQEQASSLAVPQTAEPAASSVLAVVLCNDIVGMVVVDAIGGLHPVPLTGMTKQSADAVLHLVPADRAISINVGCPSDGSKDTTVL
jgi:hypothetical protein